MISKIPLFVQIMLLIVVFVGLGLTVVAVIDEFVDKEKMSEKAKDKLATIQAVSFLALFLSGLLALVGAAVFDSRIPLSELSDKIHVEGEKVVFEPISNDTLVSLMMTQISTKKVTLTQTFVMCLSQNTTISSNQSLSQPKMATNTNSTMKTLNFY